MESKPKDLTQGPRTPENTGRVTMRDALPQVVIEWNPAGDGVTVENFSKWGNPKAMSGVSNRYAPLNASKLG